MVGLVVVTQVKKVINQRLTKQHEKVGRIFFRLTAGLIAFLISLSYANGRINQTRVMDSLDTEAALIVNVVLKLNMLQSKEANVIKESIKNYINSTISDSWKNVEGNPFYSKTSEFIITAKNLAYELPVKNQTEEKIKNDIIAEVNEITKLMQVRIYSQKPFVPYLVYILGMGLIFVWIFFTVYDLDIVSLSFLSLYNIFIVVLIYFIFMMSNPLIGPLKIDAHSFTIMKMKGFDNESNKLNIFK